MIYYYSGSHIYKNNINKQSIVVKPYYHQTTNVMRSSILGTSYSWLAQYDKAIASYSPKPLIFRRHTLTLVMLMREKESMTKP
jgi:hypothetical protein